MDFRFNWKIKGHDKVIKSLERDIESGNISHAYLLEGPPGIGKYTIVKKTAYVLQCPEGFCGKCPVCREIEKGCHADTLEMTDDGETIKIEPVREIMVKLNLTKTSNYKILILENVERLTPESANALLKTLEDPPSRVIFLLTSGNLKEVLPTVISRVRLIKLNRLSDSDVTDLLRERFPLAEEDIVKNAVAYAQGRPGEAVRMMDNPLMLESGKKFFKDVEILLDGGDKTEKFLFAEAVAGEAKQEEDKTIIYDFLEAVELAARRRMLEEAGKGGENTLSNADKYVKLLQKTQETRRLLKNNVNARLLLENLMLTI